MQKGVGMDEEGIRRDVREGYARIVKGESCCNASPSCCEGSPTSEVLGEKTRYTKEELDSIPKGSNLGLGCENPVALSSMKEREIVIDLGSGAGIDCFLATEKVGEKRKVIGVDMTPAMLDKARENARKGNYTNVEFRLGEIEHLPVADDTADVVISNCVINLASNKQQVYEEAFRILKPGGRMTISDVVLKRELPPAVRERAHSVSCIKTAILRNKYLETIKKVGFKDLRVLEEREYCCDEEPRDHQGTKAIVANHDVDTRGPENMPELDKPSRGVAEVVLASALSITVSATKP